MCSFPSDLGCCGFLTGLTFLQEADCKLNEELKKSQWTDDRMSHYIKNPKALKKKLSTKAFCSRNITVDVFLHLENQKAQISVHREIKFQYFRFFLHILVLLVYKLKPWCLTEVALCQKFRIQTCNSDVNSDPLQQIRMRDRHKSLKFNEKMKQNNKILLLKLLTFVPLTSWP